ncbi:hypothetical protein QTN25_009745 [Entamoeba marina]
MVNADRRLRSTQIEHRLTKKIYKGVKLTKVLAKLRILSKRYGIGRKKTSQIRRKLIRATKETAQHLKYKLKAEDLSIKHKRVQKDIKELKKKRSCVMNLMKNMIIDSDKKALNISCHNDPSHCSFYTNSMKRQWRVMNLIFFLIF